MSPPLKVYHNRDVRDPSEPEIPSASASKPAATTARVAAKTADMAVEKERAFEAQGNVLKRQVLAQKGKIVGLQNQVRNLNAQYAAWLTDHSRWINPQYCWTWEGDDPQFKDWCDIGKSLRSSLESSQRQFAQEQTKLEQMQEDIRRKGYGNAVYDPD